MALIEPDLITYQLLPMILSEDMDAVADFLIEHARTHDAVAQLFQTLPRCTSSLIKAHPLAPVRADDEVWTFELLKPGGSELTMSARMLIAALNEDDTLLTDLVLSAMEWPEAAHVRLMAKLMVDLVAAYRSHSSAEEPS